jgi:hypothetical protein
MSSRYRSFNPTHKRVSVYKVTRNEQFKHSFFISPNFIFENEIEFVYKEDDNEIRKIISMKEIMPNVKIKKFYSKDSEMNIRYKGYVYEISSKFVENYSK